MGYPVYAGRLVALLYVCRRLRSHEPRHTGADARATRCNTLAAADESSTRDETWRHDRPKDRISLPDRPDGGALLLAAIMLETAKE